ncbi:uncharacterized protein N7473_001777, partial [Penicillium subrubescens]|uniref:uncharacterized protein n=1 Tax=Penicillium subrubescens TaxID=1316194 RepID=UPI002545666A
KFQVAAQALHHHQNTFHRENGSETILITGCSEGGIGDALAKTFHKKSLRVFASALNTAKVQHLKDMGLEIVQLDVTDKESIKKAVSTVKAATGGYLDIPVNNSSAGSYSMSLLDLDVSVAKNMFNVNVFAVVTVTQAFAPPEIASKGTFIKHRVGGRQNAIPMAWILQRKQSCSCYYD